MLVRKGGTRLSLVSGRSLVEKTGKGKIVDIFR